MDACAAGSEQGGPEIAVARYDWGKAEICRRSQSSGTEQRGYSSKYAKTMKMVGIVARWHLTRTAGIWCGLQLRTNSCLSYSNGVNWLNWFMTTCPRNSVNKREQQSMVQPEPETRKPEADQLSVPRIFSQCPEVSEIRTEAQTRRQQGS